MKITRKSPIVSEFLGKEFECVFCECRFELEEEDVDRILYDHVEDPFGKTIRVLAYVGCPTCDTNVSLGDVEGPYRD